jgi:hypothetical protein
VPLNVFGLKIDKQELIGEFEALWQVTIVERWEFLIQ